MGQTKTRAKAEPDRSLVEGGEDYPVRELAVATGISIEDAGELVEKHGEASAEAVKEARDIRREEQDEAGR